MMPVVRPDHEDRYDRHEPGEHLHISDPLLLPSGVHDREGEKEGGDGSDPEILESHPDGLGRDSLGGDFECAGDRIDTDEDQQQCQMRHFVHAPVPPGDNGYRRGKDGRKQKSDRNECELHEDPLHLLWKKLSLLLNAQHGRPAGRA